MLQNPLLLFIGPPVKNASQAKKQYLYFALERGIPVKRFFSMPSRTMLTHVPQNFLKKSLSETDFIINARLLTAFAEENRK